MEVRASMRAGLFGLRRELPPGSGQRVKAAAGMLDNDGRKRSA